MSEPDDISIQPEEGQFIAGMEVEFDDADDDDDDDDGDDGDDGDDDGSLDPASEEVEQRAAELHDFEMASGRNKSDAEVIAAMGSFLASAQSGYTGNVPEVADAIAAVSRTAARLARDIRRRRRPPAS